MLAPAPDAAEAPSYAMAAESVIRACHHLKRETSAEP